MPKVNVRGVGLVNFPDGMAHDDIVHAIESDILPNADPHYLKTLINAIPKGAAALSDSFINFPENVSNLGKMAYGVGQTMLGHPERAPDVSAPTNVINDFGHKIGAINDNNDPTNALGRVIDITGQTLGGGGINPRMLVTNAMRGSAAPIIRDLSAATASGVGAGIGSELSRNVNTGNEGLDTLIKTGSTLGGGILAGGALASRGTGGDRASIALKGVTAKQLDLAKSLQEKANLSGAPITGYEAIQAITGLNPKMQTQQRVTEQSDAAARNLTPMMQNRSASNQNMFNNMADKIAPLNQNPDLLAGTLQNTANDAITSARKAGNDLARPYYDMSKDTQLSPAQSSSTVFDPAINMAINKVTKDPLNNAYGKNPNTIEVLDSAKKYLDDIANNAGMQGKNSLASNAGNASSNIRNLADIAEPNYATARGIVAQNMQDVVNPMQNSQVGKLGESNKFVDQANTLLPQKPMDVNPNVIDKTITTLKAENPEIAKQFINQYLRGSFDEANQANTGGANVNGGAKFAAQVAGNPMQNNNLIQALKSSGADSGNLSDALDIFRAQGYKPAVNSATASNLQESSALGGKSIIDLLKSPLKTTSGAIDSFRNSGAASDLAKALSDPDSVNRLLELARSNGTYSPMKQQILSNLLRATPE